MLPTTHTPYRLAPVPAGTLRGLQGLQTFVSRDLPHWLGNLGSVFPTAMGRGLVQMGTAYAGQRVANLVQSGLDEWSEDNPGLAFGATMLMAIAGGGLIAWQAGNLLESGRQARAAHEGEPAPDLGILLPPLVGLVTVVGPLATAFVAHNISGDPRRGCEVLSTVMGIYLGNLMGRDFGNEVFPRMPVASYQGPDKLDHHTAILRRGWNMMLTSLVFNIPFAAAAHFWLKPALSAVDPALAPAILRGAWAVGNTLAQGWAASLEGPDGTVLPECVQRPRLDMAKCFDETAMRSFLALLPALLLKLADDVSDNEPACYALLISGFIAQGVGEWRGPLREFGAAGQHLQRAGSLPEVGDRQDVVREDPLTPGNLRQMQDILRGEVPDHARAVPPAPLADVHLAQEILNRSGLPQIVVVRADGTRTDLDTLLREREVQEQISAMVADPERMRLTPAVLREMRDISEGPLRDILNSEDNDNA